ncbi:protoporphyrinogen oxidase [Fusarium acutatum]|uniref:Protoporphyrinogen oxidase n=1 Tax=Fusarium acutatum TaxID=78861 RepID=A0A8H4JVG4_9HYPO|nr:protoporphyrinogen oxidase [Fusarium acutatum]
MVTNGGAVEAVTEIAEDSLDYVIANAGLIALWSQWDSVDVLARDPEHLAKDLQDSFNVNVIENFHLFNLFTPLVLKRRGRKVIAISSGMSNIEFIRQFEIEPAPAYAISKAGTSVLSPKFAARYAKEGVLFMSIRPGSVDSGFEGELTEEQKEKVAKLGIPEFLEKYLDASWSFNFPTGQSELKLLCRLYNRLTFLISYYTEYMYGLGFVDSIPILTSAEFIRIQRAFLRFEIYCRVFPANNSFPLETVSANLESQFMSTVDNYARLAWPLLSESGSEAEMETKNETERKRERNSLVELTALDQTSLSLFSKEDRYRSSDNISYMTSLGLDFIYDLCTAGEGRSELIRSNCQYSREFLPDALRYSPTWPPDHQCEETATLKNDSLCSNLGYLIFSRVEGDERMYKPITTAGGRYSGLRQLGYVFWDSERILCPEIYDKLEDMKCMLWQDINFRFHPGAQKRAGERLEEVRIQQFHMEKLEREFGYTSRPPRASLE